MATPYNSDFYRRLQQRLDDKLGVGDKYLLRRTLPFAKPQKTMDQALSSLGYKVSKEDNEEQVMLVPNGVSRIATRASYFGNDVLAMEYRPQLKRFSLLKEEGPIYL